MNPAADDGPERVDAERADGGRGDGGQTDGGRGNGDHRDAAETALDRLIEAGAVAEAADGSLTTTDAFEDTRSVYHDTYGTAAPGAFEATAAEVFGLTDEAVEELIDAGELTRRHLVAYLSVRSFFRELASGDGGEDDSATVPDPQTAALMAQILVEIGPGSPVPPEIEELGDGDYDEFLRAHPDAVLTLWKRHCDPCEALKREFDDVLAAVPAGVAVAGLDGEAVPEFCGEFGVNAAPAVLLFKDGALAEKIVGKRSVEALAERFAETF
jgi:thiol-disulfide isomerase/thioredoxin